MESLKNTVYDLILIGSSGQYDLRMIASVLKLDSTADFVMLNKVLNQLEDEYLIVRNKKINTYLLIKQEFIENDICKHKRKRFFRS